MINSDSLLLTHLYSKLIKAALVGTLVCFISNLCAQKNPYLGDLNALKSVLQKTPSYKVQIKGDKLKSYNKLYNSLATDTGNKPNSYQYFYNLAQLVFPLRDNHLAFYQLPDVNNFKDRETIDRFVKTAEFLAYPRLEINLDSLKAVLLKKHAESIEGVYYYDKFYSVGLFKSNEKEYIGVVIDSEVSLWLKGQIAIHLYEYQPGFYKAIYGHPLTKNFLLEGSEKYRNLSLVNSYFYGSYSQKIYSKQRDQADYINLPKNTPAFQFKSISSDVQYLLVKTFQANNAVMQNSNKFFESIKDSLTASNLVLDLRNNDGGSKYEAKRYLKLLKEFTRKGHLYILLNNETLSQAEILTLHLKELKNVTTVGQTTKGMLTYGSNSDKRIKLPSQQFEIYITDMKGTARLLEYEDGGIEPDIILNGDTSWIEQVVELIRKK